MLRSQLPWPEGAELDGWLPSRWHCRPGATCAIDYSGDEPVARVRVQDLFGTTRHPTAGGRPIVLHLLSPADRPIQITADLPGFWSGSWAEVRKELAGRYPKHQWPIDPASARTAATEGSLTRRLRFRRSAAAVRRTLRAPSRGAIVGSSPLTALLLVDHGGRAAGRRTDRRGRRSITSRFVAGAPCRLADVRNGAGFERVDGQTCAST